jgi:hypothetical protein
MGDELITEARISAIPRPMPEGMFDDMPIVWARVNEGQEQRLFSFYPDEVSFDASEFIGLTIVEGKGLLLKKIKPTLGVNDV